MKRLVSLILTAMLLLTCAAGAESVWVEEEWQHVYREVDCDGLPMIIDADVMQVPADTMAQEYHVDRISNGTAKKMVEAIDWEALGFSVKGDRWISDCGYYNYHIQGDSYVGIFCTSKLSAHNTTLLDEISSFLRNEAYYMPDFTPLSGLEYARVDAYAEHVAQTFGYKIAKTQCMKRYDVADLAEKIEISRKIYGRNVAQFTEEELAPMVFYDAYYPVYYQGLRLYSGDTFGMPGEAYVEATALNVAYGVDGVVRLDMPIFHSFVPVGKPRQVISAEEALQRLEETYTEMYLPGIERITVHEAALEYVEISADAGAFKGFTMYPVWWMRMTVEQEGGTSFETYNGFHAVTGKQLY